MNIQNMGLGDVCVDFGILCDAGVDPSSFPNVINPPSVSSPTVGWDPYGVSTSNVPGTTVGSSVNGTSTTPNFWTTLTAGLFGAGNILGTRYAVPQLNNGQYLATGPNGQTVQYQLYPGQSAPGTSMLSSSSLSSLGGMLPILLIGGIGIMVISSMSGKK